MLKGGKKKQEKSRKYLIGWHHKVTFIWGMKKEEMKKRTQGWIGVWGMACWMYWVPGQIEHLWEH